MLFWYVEEQIGSLKDFRQQGTPQVQKGLDDRQHLHKLNAVAVTFQSCKTIATLITLTENHSCSIFVQLPAPTYEIIFLLLFMLTTIYQQMFVVKLQERSIVPYSG